MKMNSPKRKVTDLLPTEAILISSDADLKVLEEFEKAGVMWLGGREKPTEWNPIENGGKFPFYLYYGKYQISWSNTNVIGNYTICLATDFIPTEAEKVEVDDYWKTRCELAEAIIEACPCDPDITNEQIEAWKNYREFIKTRNPETK